MSRRSRAFAVVPLLMAALVAGASPRLARSTGTGGSEGRRPADEGPIRADEVDGGRLMGEAGAAPATDLAGGPPPVEGTGGLSQSAPTITYRLADTWAGAQWKLTAGRYRHAGDVSSAPDGTVYLLDVGYNAIHILERDGAPRGVFAIPPMYEGRLWAALRLDVGPGGELFVLSRSPALFGQALARVDRWMPDGRRGQGFELPYVYQDIAVGPTGQLFLTTRAGLPRVDVVDRDGGRVASFGMNELRMPGALDVAADGTAYVVNLVPDPGGDPPAPDPTPTREPSRAQDPATPTPTPGPDATEGVAVFGADFQYRRTVPFNGADDVAVGPAGVFVSRGLEVFALGEADPLYSLPYPAFIEDVPIHLAVPADGRLLASMWHCYFQGLVRFDQPAARPAPAAYGGVIDRPPLEGPVFPFRLAAGDDLSILQGRFSILGDRPDQTYHPAAIAPESEPQSVQRWSRQGGLTGQLGVCAGGAELNDVWWALDVAADGPDVYTVDPRFVQRRADPYFPAWSFWPGVLAEPDAHPRLAAASAEGGHVAVLDAGMSRVIVLGVAGDVVATWPFADPSRPAPAGGGVVDALPVDIALAGDRVYLADAGRRVTARARADGGVLGGWRTHDVPLRIAAGPGGDVFVLGRGGRAYRYTADGRPIAAWEMPDMTVDPLDITVDDDGRVYVGFVRREKLLLPRGNSEDAFTEAGVWVFEPVGGAPVPLPPGDGCLAWPDKGASPREISLGEAVEVALAVDGACPDRAAPAQVAIVLDTSRSMNGNDALERARAAVLDLLGRLDPERTEVALITFADAAALAVPLGRAHAAAAARVAGLAAAGDTRMGDGIALARGVLAGARSAAPGARRQVLLLVTDGGFKDQPQPAADQARADGVEVYVLVTRTQEFLGIRAMAALAGDRVDRVLLDPDRPAVARLADDLVARAPEDGLFETITVRDELPANMRYVPGSAVPPAVFDGAARTLTWTLGPVAAAGGVRLSFRVQPLAAGLWPTNVEATAGYRDALGVDGRLVFPIPRVRVYGPPRHMAYLPFATARACFRSTAPLDVVLVLDTSSSMADPAGDGRSKLDAARAAAEAFVGQLQLGRDRAAAVAFADAARRAVGLTGDRAAFTSALGGLATSPGTRIDRGLAEARAVLREGRRRGARPVVVLLTDGLQAAEAPAGASAAEASRLKADGALVYAIGLGDAIDRDLLRAVATRPGDYFESPSAADLTRIYGQIMERLVCVVP